MVEVAAESALELLAILNAAERLNHINPLKSVGLHPLKGNRRGQWAIARVATPGLRQIDGVALQIREVAIL